MKTERELLELAAKAGGYDVREDCSGVLRLPSPKGRAYLGPFWNPPNDSNQALRLAVDLGIEVCFHHNLGKASAVLPGSARGCGEFWESGEPMTATCLAITKAAAAIQEAKEAP